MVEDDYMENGPEALWFQPHAGWLLCVVVPLFGVELCQLLHGNSKFPIAAKEFPNLGGNLIVLINRT
jgi:hypothetical protein